MRFLQRISLLAIAISFLLISTARGQIVGGTIGGVVRDSSGATLGGATVVVRQIETGTSRTLTTSGNGLFNAPSIPVGHYTVTASHDGFDPQTQTSIELSQGQSIHLDFLLGLATVKQQVEVSAAGDLVNVTTQSTSGLIEERQVKELPLNGRSYDALITLNPGTVNYSAQRSGGIGTSNSSVGNMFSVSGRRPQDNLFLLNGIEYTGASLINVTPGGTSGQLLGVDAVKEFNVVSDTYGAGYGKRDGAQVSIVTTSGTNHLHGTVFEFLRNSVLDARNYFDQGSIPEFQRNQFGASLGGPLRKDRLFAFGNYEGFRQAWGLSAVTFVPDDLARQGYLPDSSGNEQYVGVNPSVQPLLALWPEQNGPEVGKGIAKAFSNPKQHIREDFGTTRIDDNLGSKDLLFGIYTVDDSFADTPTQNPLSRIGESLREQVASVQEQHVFSPSLLNTARFGFSRASFRFNGYIPGASPSGWVANRPLGAIVISGSTASNGASAITQAGTNTGSSNATSRNLYTVDDHVYWSRGKHQIEAGIWLQRIQSNDLLAQYQNGQASFASLETFLQGTVKTFTVVPSPTELGWRSLEAAAFLEDVWKVNRRLELRLGFRSESTNGWNEAQGRASNYAIVNGVLQTNPVVGTSALSQNRATFLPDPRVGFAWDVWGNGKTAVRGGFGIYRSLLDTLDYRLDQTAPFNTAVSLSGVPVSSLQITPGTQAPAGAKVSPSNVQPDIATPTVLEWSLHVQQQVAPNTALTLSYIGSHSYHQILSEDMNEPVPSFTADGTPYYPSGAKNANPALANTTSWVSQGVGLYNAFEADLRRSFAGGLQFRGNYTFAKNLDDGSAWNTSVSANTPAYVEFPVQPKLDWGPAAGDVRHSATVQASYELPLGSKHRFFAHASGPALLFASGWSASGIVNVQTGFPFSPQLGYNPTGNGDTRNPVRPNWNPAFSGNLYPHTPNQWFNPQAFLAPATGTFGNVRRDSLVGPGLTNVDFSAVKNTHVSEGVSLEFRAEFFNLLNHSNFLTPNPVVYSSSGSGISPTAGVITATSTSSRQIQFGAKVQF